MINRISRRDCLRSLAASVLPPPCLLRPRPRAAHRGWRRCVARARERVARELSFFKELIAPLVVQSGYRDERGRWQFAPDYPRLRSYQVVTDELVEALREGRPPEALENQPAMQEVSRNTTMSDSCVVMNGREAELERRCWIDTVPSGHQWLFWNCKLNFATSSPDRLAESAKDILSAVQPKVNVEGGTIRTLASLTHQQRLAAFSRLSPFGYEYLIGPLFEIVPFTPLQIFSIGLRQRCRWMAIGDTPTADKLSPPANGFRVFDSSKADFLCRSVVAAAFCFAISTLTNNHFFQIVNLARRAEQFAGDWMSFIPGEIVSGLYQKVLVLNRLCEGDWRALELN